MSALAGDVLQLGPQPVAQIGAQLAAGPAGAVIETAGLALLIREAAEPAGPLRALAFTLPAEPDLTSVLISAPVAGRADLAGLLDRLVRQYLSDYPGGLRLVPAGHAWTGGGPPHADELTRRLGRRVVATSPAPDPAPDPDPDPAPGPAPAGAACGTVTVAAPAGVPVRYQLPAVDPGGPDRLLVVAVGAAGTVSVHGDRTDWRPVRPPARRRTVTHAPAEPARRPTPPGTATRAGRSLAGPGGAALTTGWPPVLAGYVLEVSTDRSGIRIDGRLGNPISLAAAVRACPGWRHRPVVVVHPGDGPEGPAGDLLYGALADRLGVPVTAAAPGTAVTWLGVLVTGKGSRRYLPRRGATGGRTVRTAGPLMPARAVPLMQVRTVPPAPGAAPSVTPSARAHSPAAAPTPAHSPVAPPALAHSPAAPSAPAPAPIGLDPGRVELLRAGRWPVAAPYLVPIGPFGSATIGATSGDLLPSGALPPAGGAAPAQPAGPAPPAAVARPVTAIPLIDLTAGTAPADRSALRELLGGQYDVHARIVTRILAEQPGLRMAGKHQQQDMAAALVALRAYCCGGRDRINGALRRPAGPAVTDEVRVLSWWATLGLRGLPTILGPVFRLGRADPDTLAVYRAGMELIEPAFVDADLVRRVAARGPAVEYVIWAGNARRLDPLRLPATGGHLPHLATFAPATRFRVLAVEEAVPASGPAPSPAPGGEAGRAPGGEARGEAGGAPARVYLREVVRRGGRVAEAGEDVRATDERGLDRLRRALLTAETADTDEIADAGTAANAAADTADTGPATWPIGVDGGRLFTTDAGAAAAAADWGQ